MTKSRDGRATSVASRLPRWTRNVANLACGWAMVFAAISFYWACGGTIGADTISPAIAQLAQERVPWLFVALWFTAFIKVFIGCIALTLNHSWGEKIPAWLLLTLVWGIGTLFFVHGLLYLGVGALALTGRISVSTPTSVLRWYTFLWGPWWLVGGILFLAVAWMVFQRSSNSAARLLFSAIGIGGALVLLALSGGTIG